MIFVTVGHDRDKSGVDLGVGSGGVGVRLFAFKMCLPHRSVTSFLRSAPPPKKNPGSAHVNEFQNSKEDALNRKSRTPMFRVMQRRVRFRLNDNLNNGNIGSFV